MTYFNRLLVCEDKISDAGWLTYLYQSNIFVKLLLLFIISFLS